MGNFIKVTAVSKNGFSFIGCPRQIHLPCPAGTVIDGVDYFFNTDDLQQTWNFPPTLTEKGGSTASFPAARVKNGWDEYYIIADLEGSPPTGTVNQLIADACNACCDSASPPGEEEVVATPDDIIPALQYMAVGKITQDCANGICTYDYFDTLPADGTETYSLQFSCAGQLYSSGATTFTTKAAALAYAQANWGSVGTWALNGNQLSVTGTSCAVGVLRHTNV